MACRLRSTIPMIALLLSCSSMAYAADCWRDDSRGLGPVDDMTLAQAEPPAEKSNLTMEQHHVIKEIVLKDIKPTKTTADVKVSIGGLVPAGVDVQPFPPEVSAKVPQVKSHGFFVTGDHVIIVSPKDNKVTDIID